MSLLPPTYAHSPGYQQGRPGGITKIPEGADTRHCIEVKPDALNTQVGGTHYTDMVIQPAHYNLANGMGWAEGDAISYISRWRAKGGLQDLRKARQTLLLLIEHEEALGTK